DLAATLAASPVTFAGPQAGTFNHYIVAYQDLTGSVRIADMDIQASGAFTTTAQGDTLAISDMVQLTGVSLASLQPGNITFRGNDTSAVVSSGQTVMVSAGQTADGIVVLSGGTLAIQSGGVANATNVSAGGAEIVSSGGVASGDTVLGWQDVLSGGIARGTIVG